MYEEELDQLLGVARDLSKIRGALLDGEWGAAADVVAQYNGTKVTSLAHVLPDAAVAELRLVRDELACRRAAAAVLGALAQAAGDLPPGSALAVRGKEALVRFLRNLPPFFPLLCAIAHLLSCIY